MTEKIAVHLDTASVIDQRTGEVSAPSEYLENLRDIERAITRIDEDIDGIKASLKTARNCREELVGKLRSAVREGKVLPLLEAAEQPDDDEEDGVPGLEVDED